MNFMWRVKIIIPEAVYHTTMVEFYNDSTGEHWSVSLEDTLLPRFWRRAYTRNMFGDELEVIKKDWEFRVNANGLYKRVR